MIDWLRQETGEQRVEIAGSLRRWRETIGDIDLLVASSSPGPVMEALTRAPSVLRTLARGDTKTSVVVDRGVQIDLRVVPEASWGAALLYFTGSKEHNVRLRGIALRKKLLLNEYGLYRAGEEKSGAPVASSTEDEIYAALGMQWIAPELREDRGEIQAAAAGELPELLQLADVRGDLHSHSNWTDGRDSIAAMARAARSERATPRSSGNKQTNRCPMSSRTRPSCRRISRSCMRTTSDTSATISRGGTPSSCVSKPRRSVTRIVPLA